MQYRQVLPRDLMHVRGGSIRYTVDVIGRDGDIVSSRHDPGGTLYAVDRLLRFIRVYNGHDRWTVSLTGTTHERVRLWYRPPCKTMTELSDFRIMCAKLGDGEIHIRRIE